MYKCIRNSNVINVDTKGNNNNNSTLNCKIYMVMVDVSMAVIILIAITRRILNDCCCIWLALPVYIEAITFLIIPEQSRYDK
jgi:hypothetical protein